MRGIIPSIDSNNWNGHSFKREGKKIVGFCPQHGGTSGTAFQVNPSDNSWYCHGCQEGGGAVQYRHFVNGGHGTPRGEDFIGIVKELADDAGVTLPESKRNQKETEKKEAVAVDPDIENLQQKLNVCSLKPDISLDCNRPPDDLFDKIPLDKVIALDAYKGWGKSKTVIKPLAEKLKRAGKRVLCLTPRVILGLELAEKIHGTYQTDLPQSKTALKNHPISVVVYDSLLKYLQDYDYIIIDEVRAGLKHLVTANTAVKLNRPRILLELENRLRGTPCLLADADVSDVEVDYFKELTGLETFYIKNEALPLRKTAELTVGSRKDREAVIKALNKDIARLAHGLTERVEAVKNANPSWEEGSKIFNQELWEYLNAFPLEPLAITSDSQSELESVFNAVLKKFPILEKYAIRLDSKATEEPWAKDLIKDLDGGMRKHCTVLWGWSPSLMVGVSQEMEWFKKGYFFYFGTIEPCEFRQQMARSRPCPKWVGWSASSNSLSIGCSDSFDPNERKNTYIRNYQDTVGRQDFHHLALDLVRERCTAEDDRLDLIELAEQLSSFFKEEYLDNPHIDLTAKIEARAAYSRSNCGAILKQELETKENFEVSEFTGESESSLPEAVGEEKEAIQGVDAELMYQGSLMTEDEASEIAESKLHKHQMMSTGYKVAKGLPGVILRTDFFLEYVIKDRHWKQAQFLLFLAKHPSVAQRLDAESIAAHAYKWLSGTAFVPDLKLSNEKVKLLNTLGVVTNGSIALEGGEYSKESEIVKQIHAKAKKLKAKIKSFFKLEVGDDPIKLIGNLLEKIGKRHFGSKIREGKSTKRVYQIPTFEAFIKSSPQLTPTDSSCEAIEKAEAAQRTFTRYTYEAAVQQSLIQRYWDKMADGEKPIFGEFECTTNQSCNTQKSVPLHPCNTINKTAPSGTPPTLDPTGNREQLEPVALAKANVIESRGDKTLSSSISEEKTELIDRPLESEVLKPKGGLATEDKIVPTPYNKPEDKIIRTSYKKGSKVWRPGRVIRYLSAEGQKLTAKYLGKAIGLVDIWLRDSSGFEFTVNPEYCI